MHLSQQKTELRASIAERLARMTAEEKAAESRSICRRLLETIPEGATVCAYVALTTEPQLDLLIKELLRRGNRVYLPVFDNRLSFRAYDASTALSPGPLKIPEPPDTAPLLDPAAAGALTAIVPGRAFDRSGGRLGRGNGGYDIWIAAVRSAGTGIRCIGAAFDCQMVHAVPSEPHDQKMDAVATAREIVATDR